MKRLKLAAALLALAIFAGSFAAARPQTEEELKKELANYDKIAKEYEAYHKTTKEMWYNRYFANYLRDVNNFAQEHPLCLPALSDLLDALSRSGDAEAQKMAKDCYQAAVQVLQFVPNTEEGKKSKEQFYKTASRVQLVVFKDQGAAQAAAVLCAKLNPALGAKAYYDLAAIQGNSQDYPSVVALYQKGMELDKNLEQFKMGDDTNLFLDACKKTKDNQALADFFDLFLNSSKSRYYQNLGAMAMSAYEKTKQKDKAALVSILDKEWTLTYKYSSANDLIKILKKHYGKDKNAAPCIAFIQKFYDESASLEQADLDALPESVKDFLPVRYMFKMKNSNDIKALRQEFEYFMAIYIGNFYIRLYEKAQKAGDEKAMNECEGLISMFEIISDEPTRFNKK